MRNPQDWVGVAHNKALDDFRKELRKPGVLSSNLCDYLTVFVVKETRLPADRPRGNGPGRRAAADGARAKGPMCKERTASVFKTAYEELTPSPAADELLTRVQSAVDQSENRWDLANRLHPILDEAGALAPIETELVSAVVSTAQHSYEYWETNLPAFQTELQNEYGDCAEDARSQGYSLDQAREICMENRGAAVSAPIIKHQSAFRVAGIATAECSLGGHFKRLAGADVVGGIIGGIKGLIGGPGGIIVGVFAGASYGSLASFLYSTWDLYWCAMR